MLCSRCAIAFPPGHKLCIPPLLLLLLLLLPPPPPPLLLLLPPNRDSTDSVTRDW
jgi:hypothetical protein